MPTELASRLASSHATRLSDSREFRIALGLALAGLLVLFWPVFCTAPAIHWNPARLAPSFALAYGKSFYALRNSAEQLGWIYGPVFPLWYLPVTLTQNPTLVILLGVLGNALTLVVPILLVVRRAAWRRPLSLVLAAALTVALFQGHAHFRWMWYFIHVDGVCLALGLMACAALHRATERERPGGWPLHAAALGVALAFWTKQLAVMLAPGMALWLWTNGHRRLLAPFLFRCVCYVGAVSFGVFAWFGAERVLFNVVLFHFHHPAQGSPMLIVEWLAEVIRGLWTWVPITAVAVWTWRSRARQQLRREGQSPETGSPVLTPTARALVSLLLWVALTQLPLGILTMLRPAAGVNSLHSLHYGFVAGVIVLVSLLERPVRSWGLAPRTDDSRGSTSESEPPPAAGGTDFSPRAHGRLWGGALVVTVALGFLLTVKAEAQWALYRGHEQILRMVRAEPGRYYLPWNPLITLIAERKIYPFDDALLWLWRHGLAVPIEVVRAGVPAQPIIFYEEPVQSKFALTYFEGAKP